MAAKHAGLTIPHGVSSVDPFVVILDPATGTGTFLVEAVEVIHGTLTAKWKRQRLTESQQRAAWNEYVPKHLLPRLYGYELMMAPYAVAHMKLPLKLKETGFTSWVQLSDDDRVRVYLTNSLEPPSDDKKQREFEEWAPALAHEARAVNDIKRGQRFTVVIGNPPYSGISSNMSEAARQLVERYRSVNGKPLGERKVWLQNDYVKFLGYAHQLLLETGIGCLGYITDNSYLDGPTFRGVRSNLLQDFTDLHILNLHGSAKKKNEVMSATDQNVFDITQGVAVIHGICLPTEAQRKCHAASFFGSRESKYDRLSKQSVGSLNWPLLDPVPPFFQFLVSNRDCEAEYCDFFSIRTAFPVQTVGVQTSRDNLAIGFTRDELVQKIRDFSSPQFSDAEIRERFFPGKRVGDYLAGDTRGWSLSTARRELSKLKNLDSEIVPIHYRPFDFRFIFNSTLLVDWPRTEVSKQMLSGDNLGLSVLRRTENTRDFDYFSVSRDTISNHQASIKDGTYLLPLYVHGRVGNGSLFENEKRRYPNFAPSFIKALSERLKLPLQGVDSIPRGLSPDKIFEYIYAVLHSPGYRSRYAEFLKVDFPRLPLTGNLELFRTLSRIGGELIAMHLLESPKLDKSPATFTGLGNPEVEKVSHAHNTVWIDKAQTRGFRNVAETTWNFHIGGYQVCEKWLKDRKGRILSKDDIAHYQKIVTALSETIRLTAEIDATIEKHGGWPAAFSDEPVLPVKVLNLKPKCELVKLHPAL